MNEKAARCIKRAAFCIFSGFWNVTRNARGVTWNLRRNIVHLKKSSFQIIPTNVQHCTWLGFFLPPAVRDAGRKNHMGEWEEGRERNVFHFGCNVLMLQSSSMKSENVLG